MSTTQIDQSLRTDLKSLTPAKKIAPADDEGISRVYSHHLASGFRKASAVMALRLESATQTADNRSDLRPDLFSAQ